MNHISIINALVSKIGAKSYLEIGVGAGSTIDKVLCEHRVGVDVVPFAAARGTVRNTCSSDEFFRQAKASNAKYDIIFIDGLHHAEQVEKDIRNALDCLTPNGRIVCDNLNPPAEEYQLVPYPGTGAWTGDGWKAFVQLRKQLDAYDMCVLETSYGLGLIWRDDTKKASLVVNEELNWRNLEANRAKWLNLVGLDYFVFQFCKMGITELLSVYVGDPENAESNFVLALYYDSIDQKAAAVSYYLRAAERTPNTLLQYESLIRAALCFLWQGTRGLSVRGLLQRAISILPKRPEAYFLLARWYEREAQIESWVNCYTLSSMALEVCNFSGPSLRTNVEYPGKYGLIFEKAVSGWWVGQCEEAKNLFIDLHRNYPLDIPHRSGVINNLKHLKQFHTREIAAYNRSMHDRLRVKFEGSDRIEKNFSESYQDMFVLSILDGKKYGTYLEVGSARPFYGNNTALLEQSFGWTGVSIDLDKGLADEFNANRKNPCLNVDATKVDYDEILSKYPSTTIDYLQVDIDPAEVSLEALKKIPMDKYKFSVITFEHDAYTQVDPKVREESRQYLMSKGYILVARNIAPDHWRYYEDWWVHRDLASTTGLGKLISMSEQVKSAESFMLT